MAVNLNKPNAGDQGWDVPVNANWDSIETEFISVDNRFISVGGDVSDKVSYTDLTDGTIESYIKGGLLTNPENMTSQDVMSKEEILFMIGQSYIETYVKAGTPAGIKTEDEELINQYEIKALLSGGTIGDISISGDLTTAQMLIFSAASDPAYEDMFLRIGPGGSVVAFRMPEEDAIWSDSDSVDIALTTTGVEVLSVTPDLELTPADSSYRISGTVSNDNNNDRDMIVEVFVDASPLGSETIVVPGNEPGRIFVISGQFQSTFAANSVITVEFSASNNGVIALLGTVTETQLVITKAGAEPATAATQYDIDQNLYETTSNFGPAISRAEIEAIVSPPYDKSFAIRDVTGTTWLIFYDTAGDKFYTTELNEAT